LGGLAPLTARDLQLATHDALDPWFVRFPPIYAVAIAIVAGDALGNFRIFFPLELACVLAGITLALFLCARRSAGVAVALVAIVAAMTVPVHQMLEPSADPLSLREFPDGTMVTVTGRLAREAEHFPDKTRIYLEADRMAEAVDDPTPVHGLIRVTVLHPQAFHLGDEVRLSGRIHFPRNLGDPGEFDYEGFMARNGIAATMLAKGPRGEPAVEILGHNSPPIAGRIESIRSSIGAFIDKNLDDPVAAEMRALVIGDRGGIDDKMHQTFGRTGMAHLLVISGLHLSMVAAVMFALVRTLMLLWPALAARGWANKGAAIAAGAAVCAYAAIAGHHVSTSRALVMVIAYMIAVVIDRAREAVASLALAAIVICIALPGSSADIGFELSFASVLAIVMGMRRYSVWLQRRRSARAGIPPSQAEVAWEWMLGYVAVSFWAMLGVAPLTAYYFNQFSIVGLLANAVVVPIMGLAGTVTGLAAAAMSFVWTPAAVGLLWVAGQFIGIGNVLTNWFAGWPMGWVRMFTPAPIEIALAYAALFTWLMWPMRGDRPRDDIMAPRTRRFRPQLRHAFACAIALAIALDAGRCTYQRFFRGDLRVTFLSVGEGDSAVVRFPGSRVMVIDAGSAWRSFDMGERIVARYLWAQKIMRVDWLVLSHPDQDHFGGFDYLARNFSPREFWDAGAGSSDESYRTLMATLSQQHIPIRPIDSATAPANIGGAIVVALNRPMRNGMKHNNSSMVLRVGFRGASFLFPGDLEAPGEQAVVNSAGAAVRATVLKVPHHGSRTSSSAQFVAAVDPSIAIFSLGYQNRFHFPAPEVVQRYRDAGVETYRTDVAGAVCVDADASGVVAESCEPQMAPGGH
jgi:competence protein ComEC